MSKNLRKAVRIFPSRLDLLHFHRDEPKALKVIDVANVSITGDGLFRKHFRHEVSAARMTQVRSELLTQVSDGVPLLFVGSDESELFYVHQSGKIQRFVLKFFGRVLEGKLNGSIDFHQNDSQREDCVRFLQNIQNLDTEDCKQISEWILKGSK